MPMHVLNYRFTRDSGLVKATKNRGWNCLFTNAGASRTATRIRENSYLVIKNGQMGCSLKNRMNGVC